MPPQTTVPPLSTAEHAVERARDGARLIQLL